MSYDYDLQNSFPEKLSVDATTVEHGVQGLMYLLTECSKLMVIAEISSI